MDSGRLYCPVRREWVENLPEERVRQSLVQTMTSELGYPIQNLAVERALHAMPHLSILDPKKIPQRRADLVCFSKGIHQIYDLYPLLLIECKAVKLTEKVVAQVTGYNYYLRSYFVCIANQESVKTGWYDSGKKNYVFSTGLPFYEELLSSLKL